MNYLAHILVSGDSADHQVGGFLGDFVKGPLSGAWPLAVEQGIWLHRKLDAWSDQDSTFKAVAELLGAPHRRIAPIIIDLAIDHFLCLQWSQFHDQSLASFTKDFYQNLSRFESILPKSAQIWLQHAQNTDLLAGYGNLPRLGRIVDSMEMRRRRPLGLDQAFVAFLQHYDEVAEGFEALFPMLQQRARQHLNELPEHFDH